MLSYGCTRLEVGVQSVYEDVARDTNRGHTVRAVSESFQLAKDAGFKVVAHMMPDLPNVGLERDIEGFIVSHCGCLALCGTGLKCLPPGHTFWVGEGWRCCVASRSGRDVAYGTFMT